MIWQAPDGQMLQLSLVSPPGQVTGGTSPPKPLTDDPQLIKFTNLQNGTEPTAPYRSDKPLEDLDTEEIWAHWKERTPSRP